MGLWDRLQYFSPLDLAAVALLLGAWALIGWRINNPGADRPSVSTLMVDYRRAWMVEFLGREPRLLDAHILGNLRQGTAFFASASMIAIGGALALIGNTERLLGLAQDLSLDKAPAVVWEVKILAVLLILTSAFLRFVWSHRLFGYCAIVMASVPNDGTVPSAAGRAAKAAEINITAARSFNAGLRALYFALGALAWLLGPLPLMAATALTVLILWRREFASHSRAVLMRQD